MEPGPPTSSQLVGWTVEVIRSISESKSAWEPPPWPPAGCAGFFADAGQGAGPGAVVADFRSGLERSLAGPGPSLGQGNLAQPGVAVFRIGRLTGQIHRWGELAGLEVRLKQFFLFFRLRRNKHRGEANGY